MVVKETNYHQPACIINTFISSVGGGLEGIYNDKLSDTQIITNQGAPQSWGEVSPQNNPTFVP